mgnify:CR=1 FL=1
MFFESHDWFQWFLFLKKQLDKMMEDGRISEAQDFLGKLLPTCAPTLDMPTDDKEGIWLAINPPDFSCFRRRVELCHTTPLMFNLSDLASKLDWDELTIQRLVSDVLRRTVKYPIRNDYVEIGLEGTQRAVRTMIPADSIKLRADVEVWLLANRLDRGEILCLDHLILDGGKEDCPVCSNKQFDLESIPTWLDGVIDYFVDDLGIEMVVIKSLFEFILKKRLSLIPIVQNGPYLRIRRSNFCEVVAIFHAKCFDDEDRKDMREKLNYSAWFEGSLISLVSQGYITTAYASLILFGNSLFPSRIGSEETVRLVKLYLKDVLLPISIITAEEQRDYGVAAALSAQLFGGDSEGTVRLLGLVDREVVRFKKFLGSLPGEVFLEIPRGFRVSLECRSGVIPA